MSHALATLEYVQEALKAAIKAERDAIKASERDAAAPLGDHRPRNAARTKAEDRDRKVHELHVRLVEAGLAPAEPERYGQKTVRWGGCDWAEYRRAPDAARLAAWKDSHT